MKLMDFIRFDVFFFNILLFINFSEYPGLLKNTQVYWIKNWSPSDLYVEASFFLSSRDIPLADDLRQRLSNCLCDIHYYMLNESRQMPFVGITDRTITVRE